MRTGHCPSVSIANNTGLFGYQGSTNVVGLATAGTTTYGNGADTLISFTMSSVGHVIPYVLLMACANKSCYYSAQLHTSQNTLEIGERKKNANTVLASVPFTASANTLYWMRLETAADRSGTIEAKVWADGNPEPGWIATGNDNNALAANYAGAGATWDVAGTGESVNFSCYALNTAGSAALPCAPNPNATPTPTQTSTSTPTPTPTPTGTGGPDSGHLIRSVNDSLFDTTDQLMNDPTTQAILKTHNTPIVRMPFRDGWTDAQYLQALTAIKNTGAAPLVIRHGACVSDPYTIDNHWLFLVVQVFTSGPVYVEYGNEEDLSCNGGAGISATTYQASWNAVIHLLKANYPSDAFIGPVTYQSDPTYIATFVNGANPLPDFISWHEFVCSASDSNSYCLSHINNWATHISNTNSAVQAAIGSPIPIMITEWNLDPGKDRRYSNQSFIQQWTTAALSEWSSLTTSGLYAAFNYTCESHPDFQLIDSSDNFTYQGAVLFL